MSLSRHDAALLRGALARCGSPALLEAVDGLDLRGAKVTPVVGMPLRALQQRRDAAAFWSSAPLPAVEALVELMSHDTLAQVVEALGEHADQPTFEQLVEGLEAVSGQGVADEPIVLVLAYAVAEGFAAAPHCRRLLEEDPRWAVAPVESTAPSLAGASERVVDEEVRERRRARRAAKKRPASTPPARHGRAARGSVRPVTPPPSSAEWERTRRPHPLTPAEAATVDPNHPMTGWVVVVEVPFSATDPAQPEVRAKERPALVVAASDTTLLVRGLFSQAAPGRTPFSPWRRLGLDHLSFLDGERVAVEVTDLASLTRVGQVSDAEWNSLI